MLASSVPAPCPALSPRYGRTNQGAAHYWGFNAAVAAAAGGAAPLSREVLVFAHNLMGTLESLVA